MDHYVSAIRNHYADFSGRATRTQYWMFVLINVLAVIGLTIVNGMLFSNNGGMGLLQGIYQLFIFIPGLAIAVRRLHDTNRSGWWLLLALVPIIGAIVVIVFMLLESDKSKNNYGEPVSLATPKA